MQFVTTKLTISMLTGETLEHEGYFYDGPVALCKGDDTAKQAEQTQEQFDEQLMDMMKSQYGNQQKVMDFLKNTLTPQISNPTGYSKEDLTAMRTSATDSLSTEFQNAQAALNNSENQKNGGSDLPSGTNSQLDAALLEQEAGAKAGAQRDITVQNENLKNANYWNSINALNNQEALMNPVSYANAATAGSGAVSNLSQAVTAAQGPGIGSILGSVVGAGVQGMGAAFCPALGSLYKMADGTKVPVETLHVGDKLMGIDGEPQTIEEIQTAMSPILKVTLEDGHVSRSSRVHAFALPAGGFVVAINALGKTIRTENGTSKVVSIAWDGNATVFNVITDGSHTYMADGIWALGVGEAERVVSMEMWNRIGDKLSKTARMGA